MSHRGLYATSAGMHCIWDTNAFSSVNDYDSWSRELLDDKDIVNHIRRGNFVPLNMGSDGAMEIEVRVGDSTNPVALSERESKYLVVKSAPYLLRSSGDIGVSGIEQVSVPLESNAGAMPLPRGDYSVVVHLIAWDEEPGMQTDDGPAPGALPDYVALINPAQSGTAYRSELETFARPSA